MVRILNIGIGFLLISCISFSRDDENLTLTPKENSSESLRLAGYYYSTSTGKGEELKTLYFLYRNGVIINVGTMPSRKTNEFEQLIVSRKFLDNLPKLKDAFGLYQINQDSIEYEMWYPGPGPPKLVFLRKGKILNDSTFIITQVRRKSRATSEEVNELYHFKKFYPKPDSTNEFIK